MISLLEPKRKSSGETARRAARGEDLARRLQERLRSSDYLALRDLACEVQDDVAVVEGRLRSQYLKQVAQAAVLDVEGVARIENRIEVVPCASNVARPGTGGPVRWRGC